MDKDVDSGRGEAFIRRICSSATIPSVPVVAANVLALSKDPNVSFQKLAAMISADASLVARLLRMANSSVFGAQKKIGTVNDALVRMGMKVTRMTVLGLTLESEIGKKVPEGFEIDRFWRHSLTTATAARLVAEAVWPAKRDEAFSGGLLQDIGIVAIECTMPEEYEKVWAERRQHPTQELHEIEQRLFGASHAEVGSALLQQWGLPAEIAQAVLYHHRARRAQEQGLPSDIVRLAQVLDFASEIANLFYYKTKGITHVTVFETGEREFALSRPALDTMLERVDESVRQTCELFHLDPRTIPSYAEIQLQATQEVARLAVELSQQADSAAERAEHDREQLRRLKAETAELARLASHDELTQLLNRREFLKRLAAEVARSRRYQRDMGVLMIDIDHFKKVNDTYGHPMGDQVLAAMGRHLTAETRTSDAVGRLGGEEFAVLLPEAQLEGLLMVAEKLRLSVAEGSPHWIEGFPGLTISVGAALARHDSENLDSAIVIDQADQCLYQAKRDGRNRTRYTVINGEAAHPQAVKKPAP